MRKKVKIRLFSETASILNAESGQNWAISWNRILFQMRKWVEIGLFTETVSVLNTEFIIELFTETAFVTNSGFRSKYAFRSNIRHYWVRILSMIESSRVIQSKRFILKRAIWLDQSERRSERIRFQNKPRFWPDSAFKINVVSANDLIFILLRI